MRFERSVTPAGDTCKWQLSERERQLLTLLIQGRTNREIAAQLELSPKTVKRYFGELYRGLGVHGRVRLAMWAYTHQEALRGEPVDLRAGSEAA